MKTVHPVDFNKEWAKTVTREQFIAHFNPDGKAIHEGVEYGAEYDKIVPATKVEKEKVDKKA